jgi:hypothetical protein
MVIQLDRDVRECAAFATISKDGGDYRSDPASPGGIGTIEVWPEQGPGARRVIDVVTMLPDGKTRADYDFNLMVIC